MFGSSKRLNKSLYFCRKFIAMATSKEYSQREMIIDRYLSTGREYDGQTLMVLVNKELHTRGMEEITARSTFASDINEINSKFFYQYHKNVIKRERRGRHFVYYYTIKGFSIYDRELTDEDIADIHKMITTMRRFKGMPQFSWLEQLEVRFDQAVISGQKPFVAFDDSYNDGAMSAFEPLLRAIDQKNVVKLSYQPFGDYKMSVHVVSPYYLKQSGLRWYLLAAYKGNPNVYTFALDRIVSVEFIDDETYEPTDVDFDHYFDNIVGVTDYANRPVEHVEIWVAASELPYILSKPLHHTQKIVSQDDKGAIISIDVKLNYELEQTILSYGEGIEVMKPVELREELNKRIQKLLSIYKTSGPG